MHFPMILWSKTPGISDLPTVKKRGSGLRPRARRMGVEKLESRQMLSHVSGHTVLARFALDNSAALDIEQDASTLYWVDKGGASASDVHIRRIGKDGSAFTTVHNMISESGTSPNFSGMDIDSTDVFWRINAFSGTGVYKKSQIGNTNTPATQVSGPASWEFGNMAFDPVGSTLFVTDFSNDEVFALNKFNGSRLWTITGRTNADAPVVTDSTYVYWVEKLGGAGDRIMRTSHVGGAVSQVTFAASGISSMATDVDGNLFWIRGDGAVVRSVGGTNEIFAVGASGEIAVDAYLGNVYYTKDSTIKYKAKTDSVIDTESQLLPLDVGNILDTSASQLAVDATSTGFVYWVTAANLNEVSVHRMTKPVTPVQQVPEIAVQGNGVSIGDGDTSPRTADSTDFGIVVEGQPRPTSTFTVQNTGAATLTLGSVSLPNGFTLTEGLATSLAAGASDTFTVRLDTVSAGTKSGQISFSNNDSNENPFNFSITGTVQAAVISSIFIGVARGTGKFYLDANGNGTWDKTAGGDLILNFDNTGEAIIGDWTNRGYDSVGIHNGSDFYLDANGNGRWDGVQGGDLLYKFGSSTDEPIVGDWDGSGTDKIGVHRGRRFFLDYNGNGRWDGVAGGDVLRSFGITTDAAIVGDWNGNGTDSIGVHRDNRFFLDLNGNGVFERQSDVIHTFGIASDDPIIGDWNDDGPDNIGVHRSNRFYLDFNGNGVWDRVNGGDLLHVFGTTTDEPIIGNWAAPLLASARSQEVSSILGLRSSERLTTEQLAPISEMAISILAESGLTQSQSESLNRVHIEIAELSGAHLGLAWGSEIRIDADAAGYGWFVDTTPDEDGEFDLLAGQLTAKIDSEAAGRMDLLSAVLHELGHVIGLSHGDDLLDNALLTTLAVGSRILR